MPSHRQVYFIILEYKNIPFRPMTSTERGRGVHNKVNLIWTAIEGEGVEKVETFVDVING
jgi:hypothetical protein